MTPAKNNAVSYVAFLRGINVGGNKLLKMDDLKKAFAALNFGNVRTLLASGNVKFETAKSKEAALAKTIAEALQETFGSQIGVIVRSIDDIEKLIASNPFKGIKVTKETRLYVTFLPDKSKSSLKIPYASPEKDLRILCATDTEVCSVLTLSPDRNSVDLMKIIEKEWGKNVTTRNWNTILKIAG